MKEKRKGLFILLVIVMVCSIMGIAKADDYTVAASTYPVTNSVQTVAQISGKIFVDKLIITSDGSTDQTISVYELASSTTTVTKRLNIELDGVSLEIVDFPYHNPMKVEDFAVRKSTTGTNVNVYVLYR